MQTLLLVVELLIAIALIGAVLLQRSEGGALGIGSGGGGGFGGLFSPRGASDTLTRTTVVLGTLFFVVCLALNLLVRYEGKPRSMLDSQPATTQTNVPAPKAPAKAPAPSRPSVPTPH
jgi:preprotein translocase subunit SecG